MKFNSDDLKSYLKGDTVKVHNYFTALRRYVLVETGSVLINSSRGQMYSCVMHCNIEDALRIARIKLHSTNKRTNKEMWNDIKSFAEQRINNGL